MLGALLAVAAPSATPAQEPQTPVVDVVDVVLVNVEVWVEDRKGRPIRGLTADAFEVLEDGQPVEITHLAEIRETVDASSTNPQPLPVPDAPDALPAVAPRVEAPAHLVIYFDHMHMGAASAKRIIEDLRGFLAAGQVDPARVAILLQGFDLQAEADFGSTPEQLEAALTRIAESPPVAGGPSEARLALTRLQQAWEFARNTPNPCRIMVNEAKAELGARVGELRHSFAVTLDNLRATARFLAGLPGLKMLVLASDALELRPGADLLRFAQNVCPNERDLNEMALLGDSVDLSRDLLDFTSHANANRVTFFPMQPSGLQVSSVFGAENQTFEPRAVRGLDFTQRTVQQGGLLSLAKQTGGTAFVNRNGFRKALESVARDMGSYYSLAYAPPHGGDGLSHKIDVRVDVPKARVRHRLSYLDKTPAQVRDERLEGAIAFGLMDNPLQLRLAAGTVEPEGDGQYSVPLHLLVPSANLTFFPGAAGERANVEVVVRASDARSGELVTLERTFDPARPTEPAATCHLRLALALPEGVYVLGIALRDLATGVSSVVSTTVAIQDPERG